jgi:hypothetical protein
MIHPLISKRRGLEQGKKRNWALIVSIIILVLTVFLMISYYGRIFSFAARVGPLRIIHYVAFAGTLYIAFGVVLFAYLKRKNPSNYKALVGIHGLGNLVAFLLISIHFAGQVGRPADFYPTFGTGLALYITMITLVSTGMLLRFRFAQSFNPATNRFIHSGLAFAFYIVILVHILHGLGII